METAFKKAIALLKEAEAMTYQEYVYEDERDSGWDREIEPE